MFLSMLSKWFSVAMPLRNGSLIFFGVGLAFCLIAWLFLSRRISNWRSERIERLTNLGNFDAVATSSPYKDPEAQARRAAVQNVDARFSVMRVVLGLSLFALVGAFAVLPFLGELPQTALSFLVAVVLAIVGVAARPLIENFISGIVLSFSRQLRVGDTVLLDAEHYGTVEDINATHTVLKLWDWRRYVVPNSTMLHKEVVSYSHKDNFLWTHVAFHVSPVADLDLVERLACEAAASSSYVATYEAPQFWVREMLSESSLCWIAAWAKNPEDSWYLRSEIRKSLVKRLREHGIMSHLSAHRVEWSSQAPQEPPTATLLPNLP